MCYHAAIVLYIEKRLCHVIRRWVRTLWKPLKYKRFIFVYGHYYLTTSVWRVLGYLSRGKNPPSSTATGETKTIFTIFLKNRRPRFRTKPRYRPDGNTLDHRSRPDVHLRPGLETVTVLFRGYCQVWRNDTITTYRVTVTVFANGFYFIFFPEPLQSNSFESRLYKLIYTAIKYILIIFYFFSVPIP